MWDGDQLRWATAPPAASPSGSGGGVEQDKKQEGGGDLDLEADLERRDEPVYELGPEATDLERTASARALRPGEMQQLERLEDLSETFCRQRWGGPADEEGYAALSNHWLHVTLETVDCALFDECG